MQDPFGLERRAACDWRGVSLLTRSAGSASRRVTQMCCHISPQTGVVHHTPHGGVDRHSRIDGKMSHTKVDLDTEIEDEKSLHASMAL